jgi:hypothetical protein
MLPPCSGSTLSSSALSSLSKGYVDGSTGLKARGIKILLNLNHINIFIYLNNFIFLRNIKNIKQPCHPLKKADVQEKSTFSTWCRVVQVLSLDHLTLNTLGCQVRLVFLCACRLVKRPGIEPGNTALAFYLIRRVSP